MGFTNPYPASRLTVDSTNSLVSGMQAWFPLTQGSGTVAQCILHPSHTGTLGSGVTWQSSERGTVAVFDGTSNARISLSSALVSGQTLSFSVWLYINSSTASRVQIYSTAYAGHVKNQFRFSPLFNNFTFDQYPPGGGGIDTPADTGVEGRWVHAVVTQDSSNTKIYYDGELKVTGTAETYSGTTPTVFDIGSDNGANSFDGKMQNFQAWDRVISADEVALLHSRPWEGSNYGDIWPYSPPAAGSMTLSTDSAATSLMNNCVGWWPLTNGGSSTSAKDIVGTNDGTLNGGVTWSNTGIGTAFQGDGVDGTNITASGSATSQPVTISCWWRSDAALAYAFDGPNSSNRLAVFQYNNNLSYWGGSTQINMGSGFNDGEWHHIAIVFNGSSSAGYVDGVLKASGTVGSVQFTGLTIGSRFNGIGSNPDNIQNLRVWDRALSATEIAVLHERPWEGIEYGDTFHHDPPAPASMLPLTSDAINTDQELWLPLTDGSGTTAVDISGNSYTGTARSSQGWVTTSLGTAADNASLTNGGFTFGDQADLDMYGDKSFSLWVKPNGGSATQVLFEKRSSSGGLEGYSCYVRYNTDSTVGFLADSGSSTTTASSASALVTDVWSNVCVVVSGNNATIYVNGVAGTTVTNADFAADLSNAVDFVTGYAQRDPSTQDDFDGSVQNVRVWSRALTADEIWSIYANPWLGSNYKLASGSTPLYNYIFRTERFRRLG